MPTLDYQQPPKPSPRGPKIEYWFAWTIGLVLGGLVATILDVPLVLGHTRHDPQIPLCLAAAFIALPANAVTAIAVYRRRKLRLPNALLVGTVSLLTLPAAMVVVVIAWKILV